MYRNTSIHIAECDANTSNVCEYCELNEDFNVKADFIYEIGYFYVDNLFPGKQYSHGSVCRSHLVALAENYRDMTS